MSSIILWKNISDVLSEHPRTSAAKLAEIFESSRLVCERMKAEWHSMKLREYDRNYRANKINNCPKMSEK